MISDSIDRFSTFVPFEVIEKAGKDGKTEMVIRGVASTTQEDTDEEILEPDGFDVTKFLKSGFLNYNHLASKDPSMIIGEPTKAVAKNGQLYIEGILYPESEMARKVYETAKVLKKSSKTRAFGFSIEGKALERDPLNPKRITKASITGCAITPSPKNPGTKLEIVKGGIESMDFSPDDGEEFLIDVVDDEGNRITVDGNFVIEKSQINEFNFDDEDDEIDEDAFDKAYNPFYDDDEDDDLEKASTGEGSRGGKIVGHTKSGKPIYESQLKEKKGRAAASDHEDKTVPAKKEGWSEAAFGGGKERTEYIRPIAKEFQKQGKMTYDQAFKFVGLHLDGFISYHKDKAKISPEEAFKKIWSQPLVQKAMKRFRSEERANEKAVEAGRKQVAEQEKSKKADVKTFFDKVDSTISKDKAIGETKSGKSVFGGEAWDYHDGFKNPDSEFNKPYKEFSKDDHEDAIKIHELAKERAEEKGLDTAADAHSNAILYHKSFLKKKDDVKKAEGVQESATAEEMDGVTAKESIDGTRRKKKKIEQDKKTFTKAETYEEIFSMFNCNVEDALHLYKVIEGVQYVLTPNMEKVQISKEAIEKAQQILGLVKSETSETPSPEPKEDDVKKAEELKKAELQKQLSDLLKKADEIKAELEGKEPESGEKEKKEEKPAEEKPIEKSDNSNDILKAFDEKFQALGTMLAAKDQELDLIKSENAELKKGLGEITSFNQRLAEKLNMIEKQPLDRKSVTTTKYLEKGEGEHQSGGGGELKTISLANKEHRAYLADVLFKAAVKNPDQLDQDLVKAVKTVELGSLGDSPALARRLHERIAGEFGINVVK